MGYIVQDRVEISLFLNDVEYPLDAINSFNFIQIDVAVGTVLPTFHMSLNDSSGLITSKKLIDDASKVSIIIKGLGARHSKKYNFRVFHFRDQKMTLGTKWEADGYWDAREYWLTTWSTGIRGTSDSVLSEIAGVCGLKYNGTTTADTQLWLPQNRTYGEAVRAFTKRGYVNDDSFMVMGVDLENTLNYKNFNDLGSATIQCTMGEYAQGEVPIIDYRPKSTSGFNNKLTGYNNNRRGQGAIGTTDQNDMSKLSFTSDSRSPLFDVPTKEVQQRGYQLYSPINFGNVHEAYERAYYQNMRYANLHNMHVDFLTHVVTEMNLFNVFNFNTRKTDGELDEKYSGVYKYTAKTILVEGMNYYELFEGVRHGTNTQENA